MSAMKNSVEALLRSGLIALSENLFDDVSVNIG